MLGSQNTDSIQDEVQEHSFVREQQDQWLERSFHSPEWTHFCHLTTTKPFGTPYIEESLRWWFRRLENFNQKRVNYLYSIEQSSPTHIHIHCVLGNLSGVSIHQIRNLWSHLGFSKISLFDHDQIQGGIRYVMKDVLDSTTLGWGHKLKGMTLSRTTTNH